LLREAKSLPVRACLRSYRFAAVYRHCLIIFAMFDVFITPPRYFASIIAPLLSYFARAARQHLSLFHLMI